MAVTTSVPLTVAPRRLWPPPSRSSRPSARAEAADSRSEGGRQATVDCDGLPGEIGSRLAGQERHQARHLRRPAPPAECRTPGEPITPRRILVLVCVVLGRFGVWCVGVLCVCVCSV